MIGYNDTDCDDKELILQSYSHILDYLTVQVCDFFYLGSKYRLLGGIPNATTPDREKVAGALL